MRVDVLGLQAFIAIADHGSFVAAARALNLSQTALSHRIGKIETELGLPLFVRTTRKLALTKEGLALLPRARRAIDDLEGAIAELRRLGELRQREIIVGAIPSLVIGVLAGALGSFAEEMPGIRVLVRDGYDYYVDDQVNGGQAEFGLTVRRGTHAELDFEPVAVEHFEAVCREDHPLAARASVDWEELRAHVLIGNSVVDAALRHNRSLAEWAYQAENVSTAIALVQAGLGITVVPGFQLAQPGLRGLKSLDVVDPSVKREVGFIFRPDIVLSQPARLLMEHIRMRLEKLAPRISAD
jgi:DNA-binding transcriptional LysR family regulator